MAEQPKTEEPNSQPEENHEYATELHIASLLKAIQHNHPDFENKKIRGKMLLLAKKITDKYPPKKQAEPQTKLLAFNIDVDAVLLHLTQDMRDDWFTDTIQHRDLFTNKPDLNKVLQELLVDGNGRYLGTKRTISDIPKKGIGVRYSLETDFYDRFIYQALCSFLIPFYDPLLSHRVLSHRYNKNRTSEKYLFKARIDLWQTFEGVTKTALYNNQTLLVTDLINYFENITIDCIRSAFEGLIDHVKASGPEKLLIRNAINTLCELLARWGYSERHGLPQNRDASSFIANVVLNSVDQKIVALGYDYYRYVDDIRIICDNPRSARKTLSELISQLRTVGMNINSGKTKVLTSLSPSSDINDCFPTTDDRSQTIDSMWRSRSRRVIARSIKYIHQLLLECIDQKETQSRQFRFAVNRLIQLTEANLFDIHTTLANDLKNILIETLEDHAASTDQYCRLLATLELNQEDLERIAAHLLDLDKSIHPWQNFHLWLLLSKKKYKSETLTGVATRKLEADILQPEIPAIFIYLRCTDEASKLKPFISHFSSHWPYYHQRNFLLATSDFDPQETRPLISQLSTRLRNTTARARPHFENGVPLAEREARELFEIYDEISPYD